MDQEFTQLFEKWQKEFSFKAFVHDGIVDEERYERPHIVFVLRDMNNPNGGDLRKDLRNYGSGHKTWCNAARWAKALLDGTCDYPYDMSRQKRAEQMSRVAVINLKKEGGGARTNGKKLLKAVQEHKTYIRDELALCDPDIIICCGLWLKGAASNAKLLRDHVFEQSTAWDEFSSTLPERKWSFYYTTLNGKEVPVISFCHSQVSHLNKKRGHEELFKPLYQDMLYIRERFLNHEKETV